MKGERVLIGALAVTAAVLVIAIVVVARGSSKASSTPNVLTGSPRVVGAITTVPIVTGSRCDVGASKGGNGGPSAVTVAGPCTGVLRLAFGCVALADDLYMTARQPLDPTRIFYLTINVETYRGPGHAYQGAQADVQLTDPVGVQRWSNRAFSVQVGADNSTRFGPVELDTELGTGASGTITIAGMASCGDP